MCGKAGIVEDYWGQSEPILYLSRAHTHSLPEMRLHIKSLCTIKHISVEEHAPVQSGALARSEWDVPAAEPPLLHFYTAPTVYSLLARSHLPSRMLTPALMHADACTATLCKP